MTEGTLIEGEAASGDPARTQAEDRLLDRLDYALRGLRGTATSGPRPPASCPQGLPEASGPTPPVARRRLSPDRKRAALAVALAHAHFGAGALEAAEREFRDAVALDPENADARCGLVVTLASLFRLEEAGRELRAAEAAGVKLSPSVRDEIEKRRPAGSPDAS
jgi:hypothetical protein